MCAAQGSCSRDRPAVPHCERWLIGPRVAAGLVHSAAQASAPGACHIGHPQGYAWRESAWHMQAQRQRSRRDSPQHGRRRGGGGGEHVERLLPLPHRGLDRLHGAPSCSTCAHGTALAAPPSPLSVSFALPLAPSTVVAKPSTLLSRSESRGPALRAVRRRPQNAHPPHHTPLAHLQTPYFTSLTLRRASTSRSRTAACLSSSTCGCAT